MHSHLGYTGQNITCLFPMGLAAIATGAVFGSFYVGLTAAICGFALCLMAMRLSQRPVLSCVSYIVGVAAATLIYFGYIGDYGIPYWVPGSDDIMLESDARQCVAKNYYSVYDMVNGDTSRERLHNTKGYVVFLSYLMRIGAVFGGYHTMVPRIVNIFLLNVAALFVFRLYLEKFKEKQDKACSLYCLIALFPNSLYIASHVYRDTIAAFFLVALYYLCNKRWHGIKIAVYAAAVAVLLYCAYWVRESLLVFAVGIIIISILFRHPRKARRDRQIAASSLGVALVCIAVAGFAFAQFGDTILYYLTRYTERLSSGESGIVAIIYSLPLFPFGIPARFLAYLITPFYYGIVFNPGEWFVSTQSFCNLLISMGTVYLVSQYVYLVQGFRANQKVVLVAILIVLGIALTTFGYRHVIMVYPFMFLAIFEGKSMPDAVGARTRSELSVVVGLLFVTAFALLFIV